MPAQDLFLFRCNHAFPFHNGMIPHHHCEGFHRSCFQGAEPGYRGFIGGIACQMEPADSLYRHNAAFRDDAAGVSDGLSAPFVPIHNVYFRSAIVAAYRLRIVSPGLGIIVFLRTFRTHGKFLHTGPFPVIGQRVQDRQPRTAAGAVDERMLIPPVLRIIHLLDAFITDGDIRRYKDLALGLFALNDLKGGKGRWIRCFFHIHFKDRRSFRRPVFQGIQERVHLFPVPLCEDLHVGTFVAHRSGDPRLHGMPAHRRPEPHALHDPVDTDLLGNGIVHASSPSFPETAK